MLGVSRALRRSVSRAETGRNRTITSSGAHDRRAGAEPAAVAPKESIQRRASTRLPIPDTSEHNCACTHFLKAKTLATLVIRAIDASLMEQLRERAALHGRTMEEEARCILCAALVEDTELPTDDPLMRSTRAP